MNRWRSFVFLLIAALSFLMGLATSKALWFTLSYLIGILIITSFVWATSNIRGLKISRVTRARRTQVGQPLEERFLITNSSFLPKLWLEIRDFSTMPMHRASRVVTWVRPKQSYGWRSNTDSRIRGQFQLGPLKIRTSDPFGMFPMQRDISATTQVVVYPYTVDIYSFALPSGILSGGDALRRRTFQTTTNAAGVRDYVPGDSFGRIHWKSTARRGRLIVKEFELDPLADIWIVPDLSKRAHIGRKSIESLFGEQEQVWMLREHREYKLPKSTEEWMVTITASLGRYFLRQDRAVGLLAYGQSHQIIQPDRGERQQNRMLETLAVIRAEGEASVGDLLHTESHLFQRGTTVIVITATTDEKWALAAREITRRGLRVVTVLINPRSFGSGESAEPLHELLQANGLLTYFINYGDDLTTVLSSKGRIAV